MIFLIEKVIREKFSEEYSLKTKDLYFLKFSTSGSGVSSHGKVLFFVFRDEEKNPFLVIKTVRTYENKFLIKEGFKCLEELNKSTENSYHKEMFPRAVYLYDDGQEFIFSIETFCLGRKFENNKKDLSLVLHKYNDWQKTLLAQNVGFIDNIRDYGLKIIKNLELLEKDYLVVESYFLNLLDEKKIIIPKIYQHGDLTSDNIFVDKDNISIVDCDRFGKVSLPGFDIFHLASRFYGKNIGKNHFTLLSQYFKDLEINISIEKFLYFLYYLHELYFKKGYFLNNKDAQIIIEDFNKLIK